MPSTSFTDFTAGVRLIGGRTDSAGTAVADLSADEDRIGNGYTEGFLTWQAFEVSPDSPESMDVIVGSGTAKADLYVVEGDDDGQHPYIVRLDDASVTVSLDAADSSNPRIDEVWLVVADSAYDAGSVSLPRIAVRKGDAGASPSAPGPDSAWKAAAKLATITVGAAVTSVGTSDIADNRTEAVHLHGMPVGAMLPSAASSTPTGWLECNGAAVSRTTYARLFDAIGTSYGTGDGSTTFNVPNLAGRFPVGSGTLGSDTYSRGSTGGEAEHTLTTAELPSHSHGDGTLSTNSDSHSHTAQSAGSHTHNTGAETSTATGSAQRNPYPVASAPETLATSSSGAHTHTTTSDSHSHDVTGSTGSTGSGNAHENRPPYLGVRWIIFAAA